jgi:predicted nucleotidyltransferase
MQYTKLQKIGNYQKKLKKLLNKDLIDILIFGSFVRGGSPKDIDLALLLKKKINVSSVKKEFKNIFGLEADVQQIYLDSIYSPIWLSLIKEGFSVKKNKYLFEIYKIKPVVLFKYSLEKLSNVQKVQFSRGIQRVLGKESVILTRSVVLVPIKLKNEFIDFLNNWNIYYESREYELLPVLRKEEFI